VVKLAVKKLEIRGYPPAKTAQW